MVLPVRVQAVVDEVANRHSLSSEALLGVRGSVKITTARHEVWAQLREMCGSDGKPFSYIRIAKWFDCNHASVINGVRRSEAARRIKNQRQERTGT